MAGDGQQADLVTRLIDWARATYGWHRALFIAVNVVITAINVWMGAPWWGVWPLLITGALFTLHFLIYKASMVDEAWVNERAADLYDRSYDQGHIDSIAEHHALETPFERKRREAKERREQRERRMAARGGKRRGGRGRV